MRWSQPDSWQLQIALSPAELHRLELEQLGERPPKLQLFLQLLLEQSGFTSGTQLAVQLYPREDGGCVLFMRPLQPPMVPQLPLIWKLDDIDQLITGTVHTFGRSAHRLRRSDLYRMQDGWRLALWPFCAEDPLIAPLWDEYAIRCQGGELAAAWLAEHGKRVASGDALGLVYAYFG
ncbi:MAG: hypothetical protein HFG20_09720 [Anaerotruncus sp.]|nr:hypothetical protein [Anaerotruncus sp.]